MSDNKQGRLASEHEAREVAEAAREEEWAQRSFAGALFDGTLPIDLIDPLPELDREEQARAAVFLSRLEEFALEHIDGDRFDRESWVPDEVLQVRAELGAFGIEMPVACGGLGAPCTS